MTRAANLVRDALVDTLQADLARPGNDHFFARELLPQTPLVWRLTGLLLPSETAIEQNSDPSLAADEKLDAGGDQEGGDDETALAKAPRRTGLSSPQRNSSVLAHSRRGELAVYVVTRLFELWMRFNDRTGLRRRERPQ